MDSDEERQLEGILGDYEEDDNDDDDDYNRDGDLFGRDADGDGDGDADDSSVGRDRGNEVGEDGNADIVERAALFAERYGLKSGGGSAAAAVKPAKQLAGRRGNRRRGKERGAKGRGGRREGRGRRRGGAAGKEKEGGGAVSADGSDAGEVGNDNRVGAVGLAVLACTAALLLAAREFRDDAEIGVGSQIDDDDYNDDEHLDSGADDDADPRRPVRPKMHTFFERIERDRTGMSDDDNDALLFAWKGAWSDAGFEPVVLTIDDARRHPEYDDMMSVLEKDGGFKFGVYDEMCFVRWIAMDAAGAVASASDYMAEYDSLLGGDEEEKGGGGWMSDYDVFPLAPFANEEERLHPDALPNGGKLTVHESHYGTRKAVVPSLVSGTAEEWTRMAWSLIENYDRHREDEFWSDMFALDDIGRMYALEKQQQPLGEKIGPPPFEIHDDVLEASDVLKGDRWKDQVDCRLTTRKRAVHFSHKAMDNSVLRPGEGRSDRGPIASRWLRWWWDRCSGA